MHVFTYTRTSRGRWMCASPAVAPTTAAPSYSASAVPIWKSTCTAYARILSTARNQPQQQLSKHHPLSIAATTTTAEAVIVTIELYRCLYLCLRAGAATNAVRYCNLYSPGTISAAEVHMNQSWLLLELNIIFNKICFTD
jgi:hypothetical protein